MTDEDKPLEGDPPVPDNDDQEAGKDLPELEPEDDGA